MTTRPKEGAGRGEKSEGYQGVCPCSQSCSAPSNCQNSSFLESFYQRYGTKLNGGDLIPCITGRPTLEQGLSDCMNVSRPRPDRGESLQELFHSLLNFLALAILCRTRRRRCERSQAGFRALLFFPVSSRRLLAGIFKQNVARSSSHPVAFPPRARQGAVNCRR